MTHTYYLYTTEQGRATNALKAIVKDTDTAFDESTKLVDKDTEETVGYACRWPMAEFHREKFKQAANNDNVPIDKGLNEKSKFIDWMATKGIEVYPLEQFPTVKDFLNQLNAKKPNGIAE